MQITSSEPVAAVTVATPRKDRLTLSRSIAVSGLILLLFAWIAAAAFLGIRRTEELDARARENMNLARALEEMTVRVLVATDHATRRVSNAVQSGDDRLEQLVPFANETGLAPNILVQLSLVGPDGRFMGSNLDPDGSRTGRVDLSEREHIRAHLAPQGVERAAQGLFAQGLFIGKPVLGKVSGRWTIQLTRRIESADGRTLGVVVASLDPSYFEKVYRSVNLGRQGVVTLIGKDLTIRARVVDGQSVGMGSRGRATSPLAQGEALQGTYIADGIDGIERVLAFHKVEGYPLYIVVGSAIDQVLADWRGLALMVVGLTGLLTLAVGAALLVFINSVRRLERSNRELAASEARAQAANQAKSEFLAAISHELRTPLTSIRGFAELMENRVAEPKYRHTSGLIRRSAEHLNALLSEILDLAKVEAGEMSTRTGPVEIRPLLQGTADFFAVTAAEKGLEMRVELAADLPPIVMTDELRLKQVLNNLMSNALKFTAQGHVALAAQRDGDTLRIHVADTGPGIPPEAHEVIFERFRQADAQVCTQHGGTGLGLALARALAGILGGKLTVESTVGVGSRFTLTLPLAPDAQARG